MRTLRRVLEVSTSGYHAWCKRRPCLRVIADETLADIISQPKARGLGMPVEDDDERDEE